MKEYIEITQIKQVASFTLQITFNNKNIRIIDFSQLVEKKGLFSALKKQSEFKKFSIDMAGGLTWSCGVDLGADMLLKLASNTNSPTTLKKLA